MDYLLKQATLNKLAQTRLAVNYVIRDRMVKKAAIEYYGPNGRTWAGWKIGAPKENPAIGQGLYRQPHIDLHDSAEETRNYIDNSVNATPVEKDNWKRLYYNNYVATGKDKTHPNTRMIPPPLLPPKKDYTAPQKWKPNNLTTSKQPQNSNSVKLQPGPYPPSQFPPMPEHVDRMVDTPPTPSDIVLPELTNTPLGRLRLMDDGTAIPFYERYSENPETTRPYLVTIPRGHSKQWDMDMERMIKRIPNGLQELPK